MWTTGPPTTLNAVDANGECMAGASIGGTSRHSTPIEGRRMSRRCRCAGRTFLRGVGCGYPGPESLATLCFPSVSAMQGVDNRALNDEKCCAFEG